MNNKGLYVEQELNIRKNFISWGLRQIFIVFTGTIAIVSFVVCFGFLLRMYMDQYSMGRILGLSDGYIYGLIFVIIISFLWTIQSLVWYYFNKNKW